MNTMTTLLQDNHEDIIKAQITENKIKANIINTLDTQALVNAEDPNDSDTWVIII